MSKITIGTEFIRSLAATDKDGKEVSRFIAQPYLTAGMYVCIEPGSIQLCPSHKEYPKWVKDSIKKMEANGHKVITTTSTYGTWFTEEEIKTYLN
jgi:hypothetical protein